ncbi:MAG TPA: LuxR C-terminal-related transcriptional regulator [Bacteroidales bacterium]|nr:LuxR C-terminal-related transcriptional regulator [Bacteroidales bacterium]HPS16720.1 LuxR C-terminal-related transcriptional regulator [Bacteroidales bacterium]
MQKISEVKNDIESLQDSIKKLANSSLQYINDNIELKEKVLLYDEIISKANVLIHIDDLNTSKMIWGNHKQFIDILGFSPDDIVAMGIDYLANYYHPDDFDKVNETISFFLNDKGEKHSTLFRIKHKNGEWLKLYTTRTLFKRTSEGKPWLVLAVSVNLSTPVDTGAKIEELLKENMRLKNQLLLRSITRREEDVLRLIANGFSNKEISTKLIISVNTVDSHRKNLLKKLNLKNVASLVCFAVENGLN